MKIMEKIISLNILIKKFVDQSREELIFAIEYLKKIEKFEKSFIEI